MREEKRKKIRSERDEERGGDSEREFGERERGRANIDFK